MLDVRPDRREATPASKDARRTDAKLIRRIGAEFEDVHGMRVQNANVIRYGGREYVISHRAILTVVMTPVCNAACKFCSNEVTFTPGRSYVSYTESLARTREFAQLAGVRKVAFTGGEPTLNPQQLLDTASAVIPGFERARLHTNASRIFSSVETPSGAKPLLEGLIDAGLSGLSVSVAHSDPDLNQVLMRWKNPAWAVSEDTLREIAGYNSDSFSARLSCVLTEETIRTPEQMVCYLEWGRGLGFRRLIFRTCSKIPDAFQKLTQFSRYGAANSRSVDELAAWFEARSEFELTYRQRKSDSKVDVFRWGDMTFDVDESSEEPDPDEKIRRINFMPDGVTYTSWIDPERSLLLSADSVVPGCPA